MTREEKKKELTDLFLNSALTFGEVIDEAFEFADEYPQDWISVEDELPPVGEDILMFSGGFGEVICGYRCNDAGLIYYGYNDNGHWCNITHWMPLPNPPKKGD